MSARDFIRALGPRPEDQIDEVITCNEEETIEGDTYYLGYAAEMAEPSVFGNDSPTYGAWTAEDKGGTRYEVISSSLPGANQVLWDHGGGVLITSAEVTLYVRYAGIGRLRKTWEMGPLDLSIVGLLNYDEETIVAKVRIGKATSFDLATISMIVPVGADLTFTITHDEGEGATSDTITIPDGATSAQVILSPALQYAAGEHIVVTVPANAAGAESPTMTFYPG